jgi:hypothetical protein
MGKHGKITQFSSVYLLLLFMPLAIDLLYALALFLQLFVGAQENGAKFK